MPAVDQARTTSISAEELIYAITHASAALALKRKFPRVGLWPLLISVQVVELLWVLFTYLGIERPRITPDAVHLDFLPYSHSITTGFILAAIAWGFGKAVRRTNVGTAIALGILSHVLLDIIHHEPNISLLPMAWGPRFGMNLQGYPILDFLVELAFCIVCWAYFRGTRGLLIGIVILPAQHPADVSAAWLVRAVDGASQRAADAHPHPDNRDVAARVVAREANDDPGGCAARFSRYHRRAMITEPGAPILPE